MSYYRSAFAAIICYDCTSEHSLSNAVNWINDFRERAKPGAPILLVACKQDLHQTGVFEDDEELKESPHI